MKFTQGNPALIAAAQAACLSFVGLAGRGATAPGAVVVRETGTKLHPFVAHFFNSQDGGYYFGDYAKTREQADRFAADKLSRYDRDGELRRAFRAEGDGYDTRLAHYCAARNEMGDVIIIKAGESGFFPGSTMALETDEDIARFNAKHGATPGMVEAMRAGSMFGWDCPGATLEMGEEVAERAAAKAKENA
jgi:hypothetical protein